MTQDTTNLKKSPSSTSLLDNHYSLLMDRMRSRMPTLKTQPSMVKATREDFKPTVEWSEEPSGRTLLVLLPGFTREDMKVQIDNAGRLLVKGRRQAGDKKVLVVDQSFDMPKDTIVEMISGRFEDGRLILLMPRKVVEEQEAMQKDTSKEKEKEEEKEEEYVQKEAEKSEEGRDESMHKERPATTEEKHDELTQKEEPKSSEDNKDQEPQKEKPKTGGEKKDSSPVLEEKPESGEEKKDDDPIRQQEMERGQEKKDEPAEKKPEIVEENKKEENAISSAMERVKEENHIQKMKSRIRGICADKPKEIRKKISSWRAAEGSRLDSGSFDGMLEKLNRNRKVIAVAVVAFSVVFYVSHKLRTSGR